MPAVCCREYLAIFKKTVAMHEGFLQRLAAHPTLHRDHNFYVFLEYGQDVSMGRCSSKHALGVQQAPSPSLPLFSTCVPQLSVRGKNRRELLGGFLRNIVKSADEALITGVSGLKVNPWTPFSSGFSSE